MANLVTIFAVGATCYFLAMTGFSPTALVLAVIVLIMIRIMISLQLIGYHLLEIIEILQEEDEDPDIYHPPYEIE